MLFGTTKVRPVIVLGAINSWHYMGSLSDLNLNVVVWIYRFKFDPKSAGGAIETDWGSRKPWESLFVLSSSVFTYEFCI